MPTIFVHPLGNVPIHVFRSVQRALETEFRLPVKTGRPLIIPGAVTVRHRPPFVQYHSTGILDALLEDFKGDHEIHLAITDEDLFVPELNFVFGEALREGRCAVVSVARLNPRVYGERPNRNLLVQRAIKESIHEVGHAIGLEHCDRSDCVMWFSNSLFETDAKGSEFCSKHAKEAEQFKQTVGRAVTQRWLQRRFYG